MKWIEYKIKTVNSEVDKISLLLEEIGLGSFELKDTIPLSAEDEKKMFTDIPARREFSEEAEFLVYSTEEDVRNMFSTGSSIRDKQPVDTFLHSGADKTMEMLNKAFDECYADNQALRPTISFEIRDDSEWKDKYKESFKAFRISDKVCIKPVWEDKLDFEKDDDIVITINPGSGFGTGMHETTRLCLNALEREEGAKNFGESYVLDVGCGSGILGILALKMGAKGVCMMDIDESAVQNVFENLELNEPFTGANKAFAADILTNKKYVATECAEISKDSKFDIVLANILADVIIPLCEIIPEFLKPGGTFITSGILVERAQDVKEALIKNGFKILNYNENGEWACFEASL